MANKSNCYTLASVIETQPFNNSRIGLSGFGMTTHFHACGTPMCISGWAASLHGNFKKWLEYEPKEGEECLDPDELACEYLGISLVKCDPLFYPDLQENWNEITPTRAAMVLRHLGDTGEIDWTVAGLTPQIENEDNDNE